MPSTHQQYTPYVNAVAYQPSLCTVDPYEETSRQDGLESTHTHKHTAATGRLATVYEGYKGRSRSFLRRSRRSSVKQMTPDPKARFCHLDCGHLNCRAVCSSRTKSRRESLVASPKNEPSEIALARHTTFFDSMDRSTHPSLRVDRPYCAPV